MAKLSGMSNQEETLGILSGVASDDLGKTALCASAIFLALTVTKFLQTQIQMTAIQITKTSTLAGTHESNFIVFQTARLKGRQQKELI